MTKTCKSCKKVKPIDKFRGRGRSHEATCYDCKWALTVEELEDEIVFAPEPKVSKVYTKVLTQVWVGKVNVQVEE